ncbi:MAG: hypothetical protein IE931_08765 [Sphingobacteriales bacterium]|nr:hypothetical protein [Sphingobacteriales bacterium]
MIKNRVFIFSDSIQSGKTSRVFIWIKNQEGVSGILTPDIGNKRKLLDIAEQKLYDFETADLNQEDITAVGRFIFLNTGFEKARSILRLAAKHPPKLLVVDEIGKLELDGNGLEPVLSEILLEISEKSPSTEILLLVRDSLLGEVVEKYKFENMEFVDHTYFLNKKS